MATSGCKINLVITVWKMTVCQTSNQKETVHQAWKQIHFITQICSHSAYQVQSAGYNDKKKCQKSVSVRVCVSQSTEHKLDRTSTIHTLNIAKTSQTVNRARHWSVSTPPGMGRTITAKSLKISANFRCPKVGKYQYILKGKVLSHKPFWILAKNLLRGNSLGDIFCI